MPSGIGTESLGMIGCIFAENGPLESGIESSFSGTGWGLKVISDGFLAPILVFSKEAPTIFRRHIPSGMGTESLAMIGCIFAENGPLEGGIESSFWVPAGVLRVISYVILTYTRTFSNQEPYLFRKHMLGAIHTAKLGMIRCIYVEK